MICNAYLKFVGSFEDFIYSVSSTAALEARCEVLRSVKKSLSFSKKVLLQVSAHQTDSRG